MRKYNTEAIVLKNRTYRDADRIFTFFTRKYGKTVALARGVRKITSRRAGNLDTLNLVKVKITKRKNGFDNIDEAESLKTFSGLKKDLGRATKAFYIVELVDRSFEEESPDEKVFELLLETLEEMNIGKMSTDRLVTYFELNLLRLLGYKPRIPNKYFEVKNISEEFVRKADERLKKIIYEYLTGKVKSLEIGL
jgi:DNA repair protein RecO (recombination protein O)